MSKVIYMRDRIAAKREAHPEFTNNEQALWDIISGSDNYDSLFKSIVAELNINLSEEELESIINTIPLKETILLSSDMSANKEKLYCLIFTAKLITNLWEEDRKELEKKLPEIKIATANLEYLTRLAEYFKTCQKEFRMIEKEKLELLIMGCIQDQISTREKLNRYLERIFSFEYIDDDTLVGMKSVVCAQTKEIADFLELLWGLSDTHIVIAPIDTKIRYKLTRYLNEHQSLPTFYMPRDFDSWNYSISKDQNLCWSGGFDRADVFPVGFVKAYNFGLARKDDEDDGHVFAAVYNDDSYIPWRGLCHIEYREGVTSAEQPSELAKRFTKTLRRPTIK